MEFLRNRTSNRFAHIFGALITRAASLRHFSMPMRLYSIGLLLSLASFCGCSSLVPLTSDRNRPKADHETDAAARGELIVQTLSSGEVCKGRSINGRRTGHWQCVYPNGITSITGDYINGLRHGQVDAWTEDAVPDFKSAWKSGVLDGPFISFHRNGKMQIESNYSDGILHGRVTEWDDHGRRISESHYERGLPHGLSREWHENGLLKSEQTYVRGQLHGVMSEWRANGSPRRRASFKNGVQMTPWRDFSNSNKK